MSEPFYPVIPAEEPYTEAERSFIENSPPGLWPDNQDSYMGQWRKVVTDEFQKLRDILYTLWLNMVPQTADEYLDRWEAMLQLPQNPAGKSVRERRVSVLARLQRGAFTRDKRDKIINDFVGLTIDGDPAAFFPEGITLVGGIPLYPEYATNLSQKFQVYEFVQDFYYRVVIATGYFTNPLAMERELKRITPAGIRFDIDDDRAVPVSLYWLMIHLDPQAFWPMRETSGTDVEDAMLDRTPGEYVGSPTLNDEELNESDTGNQPAFDGTNDHVTVAPTSWLEVENEFTLVAIVKQTDQSTDQTIFSSAADAPQLQILSNGALVGVKTDDAILAGTEAVSVIVGEETLIGWSKDGTDGPGKLWINGEEMPLDTAVDGITETSGLEWVLFGKAGGGEFFEGNAGYAAVYNRELTAAEWHALNQARLGLLP